MALIDKIWLATLTKNEDDAGSPKAKLNLTINVYGEDVLDSNDFIFLPGSGPLSGGLGPDEDWLGKGQAALVDTHTTLTSPIDSNTLTNSSVRLGIRSDDAWGPENILLLGRTDRRVIALAMETEIDRWLSTDSSEGKLSMPIRLVGEGSSSTLIHRVLLLVYTQTGETNDRIQLQISAGGNLVLQQQTFDTSQDDLEDYAANWYPMDAAVPFTRGDVLSNGGISLSILGEHEWSPKSVFVYGLDTAEGRPNEVVHLVSIPEWGFGSLSADSSEGEPSIDLPVV